MSHELTSATSMFSVKETPWHNLGKVIQEAPTAAAALDLAEMNWKVRTEPLYRANGELLGERAPAVAIINDSNGKVLGVGGSKYVPLQNEKALNWFNPYLDTKMATLETAGTLKGGTVCWAMAKILSGGSDISIIGDDVVRKFLLLTWTHDGKRAIRVGFSPTRVVCWNTLSAAISAGDTEKTLVKINHTARVEATLDDARDIMNLANQSFDKTAESYKAMTRRSFTDDQLQGYVMQVLGYAEKLAKAKAEDAEATLHARSKVIVDHVIELVHTGIGHDLSGVAGTWWAAYNGVTEYLSHEYGGSDEARYANLWMGENAHKNQKAMELAVAMAVM